MTSEGDRALAEREGMTDAQVGAALVDLMPRFFAYVLSFLVIARFWTVHHTTFRSIGRIDGPMIWLNLIQLMLVAFLPFPTSLLGGHGDVPVSVVFYGAVVTAISALTALQWRYVSRHTELLRAGVGQAALRHGRIRTATATGFFALTLPVALVAPYVTEALWVLGYPLVRFALDRRLTSRRQA